MNYEQRFREGLCAYMTDKLIKSSSVADKANIRRDSFSRMLNGNKRIYAEEAGSVCNALGVTFEFLINYCKANVR